MLRALLGAVAAGAIAGFARRSGSLSTSGLWAAFACGIAAAAIGYRWAALLIAFFSVSTALTRWGAAEKARRTDAIIPKGGARTATQVLANGGIFVVLGVAGAAAASRVAQVGALGALAAACADTWATEVGTYLGGEPRSIVSRRPLPRGMSGGVTAIGSLAAIGGAAFIASAAPWMLDPPLPVAFRAVLAGGVAGALADSLLGATIQSRRWCSPCTAWTERRVHSCGYRTHHAAGIAWMNNDTVNLVAAVIGALSAMAAA